MAADSGQIIVHQVVHGYDSGHRELQSSLSLKEESQQTMRLLSDMSGPAMVVGFESYLTGYLLIEAGFYVLARTWYAPEMDRPGCVWTHSLLISLPDLARIAQLSTLCSLFRRPSKKAGRSRKLPTFEFTVNSANLFQPQPAPNDLSRLLVALYTTTCRVVWPAMSSTEHEHPVLALWSQQWPRLRRTFRFCTGALADRSNVGVTFDLQIIPSSAQRSFQRAPNVTILDVGAIGPEDTPSWVAVVAADLQYSGRTALQNWLARYGADVTGGRGAFRPLVELYLQTDEGHKTGSAESIVAMLASSFPNNEEAALIKRDLLFGRHGEWSPGDVCAFFKALAMCQNSEPFHGIEQQLELRSAALWRQSREAAISLLIELLAFPIGPLGERICSALCSSVDTEAMVKLAEMRPEMVPILLRRQPEVATESTLWANLHGDQREYIDAVFDSPAARQPPLAQRIVSALMDAQLDHAEPVFRALGDMGVEVVLKYLDGGGSELGKPLTQPWRRELSLRPKPVLRWLANAPRPTPRTLVLLTHVLDPLDATVRSADCKIWHKFIPIQPRVLAADIGHVGAFLLSIGIQGLGADAGELVVAGFEATYQAAASNALTYEARRWLQELAPSRSWWREWDHCERLIHALVERWTGGKLSASALLRVTSDEKLLARVLSVADDTWAGHRELRELSAAAANGTIQVTEVQRRALWKYR
jgi:hypothetical protein